MCILMLKFWKTSHHWQSLLFESVYRVTIKDKMYGLTVTLRSKFLLVFFRGGGMNISIDKRGIWSTKNATTHSKMAQISKLWCLNLSTNICPSCGNIHLINIVINNELTREETIKNINFRPHFCIKNHKKWNNSFFPPWGFEVTNPWNPTDNTSEEN